MPGRRKLVETQYLNGWFAGSVHCLVLSRQGAVVVIGAGSIPSGDTIFFYSYSFFLRRIRFGLVAVRLPCVILTNR